MIKTDKKFKNIDLDSGKASLIVISSFLSYFSTVFYIAKNCCKFVCAWAAMG